MLLNMSIIADALGKYGSVNKIIENKALTIRSARLLLTPPDEIEENRLYVLTEECLRACSGRISFSDIVCTGDTNAVVELSGSANVIVLKPEIPVIDTFNIIQDIFDFYNRCDHDFLMSVASNESIEQNLLQAAKFFGNPIFLLDRSLSRIAIADHVNGKELDKAKWHALVEDGHTTVGTLNRFLERYKKESYMLEYRHAVFDTIDIDSYNSITVGVFADGNCKGYLLIPDDFQKMGNGHLCIAEYVSYQVSYIFKKLKSERTVVNSFSEQFIRNQLENKKVSYDILDKQLDQMNWNRYDNYFICVIAITEEEIEFIHDFMTKQLKSLLGDCFYLYNNGYQVFVINMRNECEFKREKLEKLQNLLEERNIHASLSMMFDDFIMLGSQYTLAIEAMRLGLIIDLNKWIFSYNDYVALHFLDMKQKPQNILAICHPNTVILDKSDRINGTVYVKTLYSYLVNERSLMRASADLFIHRNSLVYRLEKINELVNIDYENSKVREHLKISCLILINRQIFENDGI